MLNHKQFIHFKVSINKIFCSWVTAIYASPVPSLRKQLWDYLGSIASTMSGPWLLGGDFNSILYASEKRGGSPTSSGICGLFKNWFHSNSMHDLHFQGPMFTWSRGILLKRHDRAVCNMEWVTSFLRVQSCIFRKLGLIIDQCWFGLTGSLKRRRELSLFGFKRPS